MLLYIVTSAVLLLNFAFTSSADNGLLKKTNNLVKNGDFENGSLDPWMIYKNTTISKKGLGEDSKYAAVLTCIKHGGYYDNRDAFLIQQIALETGHTYTLRFSLYPVLLNSNITHKARPSVSASLYDSDSYSVAPYLWYCSPKEGCDYIISDARHLDMKEYNRWYNFEKTFKNYKEHHVKSVVYTLSFEVAAAYHGAMAIMVDNVSLTQN